jgi:hypothetical protein
MTRLSEEYSAALGGKNLFSQPLPEEYSAALGGKNLFFTTSRLYIGVVLKAFSGRFAPNYILSDTSFSQFRFAKLRK